MKTNYLKNVLLIGSGIAIAASASVFAAVSTTSIDANLLNLQQYLKELLVTSDGTPNGDQFLAINGEQGTMFAQSGNFAFDFNSHAFMPADFVGGLYQDNGSTFANGIVHMGMPMPVLIGQDTDQGDQIGISIRKQDNQIQAMIEYESTGNQDTAVQVQHQLKVKADGTTISFDDYNVLGQHTLLGLGSYGFYVNGFSGGYMGMDRAGQFTQSWDNMSLVNGYGLLGGYDFVGSKMQTGDILYINGIMDLIPAYGSDSQSVIAAVNMSNNDDAFVVARSDFASIGMFDDYNDFGTITQIKVGINNIGFNFPGVSYSFPAATGTAGQFLQTDGAGQLSWADAGGSSSTTRQIALIDTYDYVDLNNGSAGTEVTFNGQLPAGSMPAYFIAKVIQPFVSDSNKFVGTLALEYNGLSQAFGNPFAAQIASTSNSILDQVSTKSASVADFNTHHNLSNPLDVVIWFTSFDGGTNPQDRTQGQVEIYIVYDSITLP